jgi:DNA-binding transcriptional MerR regulator
MKIGALAELTGTSVPTVRYYEQVGLLPRALRQQGGQRVFSRRDIERLTFIRRCRELGFSIEQVRLLAGLRDDSSRSCSAVRDVAAAQVRAVHAKRRELRQLERSLRSFVKCCDDQCAGGPGRDCVVLGDLARVTRTRNDRDR